MFHAYDVLANQLLANANDPSWYVPFEVAVKNLSEEEAFWKVTEASNSIAEIVQHLLYWNETWQTRYKEKSVHAVPSVDNNNTFVVAEGVTFQELQQQLLEALLRWQELITKEQLDADVQEFQGSQWWEVIGNVTTHNAYHVGQIVFIRKIQKSWNRTMK
ncbi:DinB superfamily protein [compost metagenome]